MSRTSVARAAACLALAAAVAALAACADHPDPAAPRLVPPPVVLTPTDWPVGTPYPGGSFPVLLRATALPATLVASGTIGNRGGVIALPGAGFAVYFPQGAVHKPTTFTVTAAAGAFVTYDFQPHTTFDRPVALVQDLSVTAANGDATLMADIQGGFLSNGESDIDSAGKGSFAETFNAYVFDDARAGNRPHVVFFTTHFSGYAYASGRSTRVDD